MNNPILLATASGLVVFLAMGGLMLMTRNKGADFFEWWREHFAGWFANSFVLAILFFLIICTMLIGMHFDGIYLRRWAQTEDLKPFFQVLGWCVSLLMTFCLATSVIARNRGHKAASRMFFTVGVFFACLSTMQSIGIVALKSDEMRLQHEAYTSAIENTETVNHGRMEFLRNQRDGLIAERDEALANIERTLANTEDDGIAGIGSGDLAFIENQRAQVREIRDEYRQRIEEVDQLILAEISAPTVNETITDVMSPPAQFDSVIEIVARFVTLGAEPSVKLRESLTIAYLVILALVCPLMGPLLSCYLLIVQKKKPATQTGEALEINGEQVDPEEVAHAWQKHQNQKDGAQKRAETLRMNRELEHIAKKLRKKSDDEIVLKTYERMQLVRTLKSNGLVCGEIAKGAGYSNLNEFKNWVDLLFSKEEAKSILIASLGYDNSGDDNGAT